MGVLATISSGIHASDMNKNTIYQYIEPQSGYHQPAPYYTLDQYYQAPQKYNNQYYPAEKTTVDYYGTRKQTESAPQVNPYTYYYN
jgi:hypothetical protein